MSSTANHHLHQQEHNRNRAAAPLQRWSGDVARDGFNGANSSALGARAARPMMDAVNERATAAAAESGSRPLSAMFKQLLAKSEARIASLFGLRRVRNEEEELSTSEPAEAERNHAADMPSTSAPKPPVRVIDEDDYDDYDDYEPDTGTGSKAAPSKDNASGGGAWPTPPSTKTGASSALSTDPKAPSGAVSAQAKSVEEVREQLQQDKKAAEAAAERSAYAVFYTLEHDRDAMLEQQKLDEADRQVDAEMSGHGGHGNTGATVSGAGGAQYGKLSNANLGASSLALKHLIARIDEKRDKVKASDAQLRNLINEVRKNRSKWASEDRIGQEELYEAADKVLSELKAMTEHSQPFLTRVNKRDAPDYYTVIKSPMDLGTMTKKLKSLVYKSKQEFVNDLNTIWSNCLTYNADPNHFLRKHALAMKKETDKLVPLIPDIVIRDRSEVEAEERRQQNGGLDVDADGAEESDDEPIMSSRGRVGPKKGTNAVRKAPSAAARGSPAPETRSSLHRLNSAASRPKAEHRRSDFDALSDGHPAGMSTPTLGGIGSLSPAGLNGYAPSTQLGSQADSSADADGFGTALVPGHHHPAAALDVDDEDPEYKTWKQVTKRDRARVAAERHRLFKDGGINKEEPALMRTRVGMRRWMRKHRRVLAENLGGDDYSPAGMGPDAAARAAPGEGGGGESLAEDIAGEDNDVSRMLPEYYDVANGVPDLPPQLQWVEDEDGQLRQPADQDLYIVPNGHFTAPDSMLTRKLDANMRQIQETRKVCAKIGIVKQMQLQSQLYQNQFSKYSPEPLVEKDIAPAAMMDAGPIMTPQVCRAALQRSVAKIFYHAGFEEYQPTAIDVATDLAAEFFTSIVTKFCAYREDREVPFATSLAGAESEATATAAATARKSGAAGVAGEGQGRKRKRSVMETGSTTATATAATAAGGNGDDEEGDNGDGSGSGNGSGRRSSRGNGTRRRKKQRRGGGDGVSGGRGGAMTEEALLFALHQNGLDVEALESYVKEDVERLGSKASAMHSRMTGHLADLLRPAFNQSGSDGDAAFDDGSEQFVSGAFAEDVGLDYFALDDLGIAKELGLSSLSVPLHLLQNRIHNTYAAQNPSAAAELHVSLEAPPRYPPVTLHNVGNEIGLVQNFFLAKLHANGDAPLVEDEDLPVKQRPSKPRLPPTGKITAPRKRPAKEQGGNKSKKRKVEKKDSTAGAAGGAAASGGAGGGSGNGDAAAAVPAAASAGASAASATPSTAAAAPASVPAAAGAITAAAAPASTSTSTSTSAKPKQAGGSKAKPSAAAAAAAAAANNGSGETSAAPAPATTTAAAAMPGVTNDTAAAAAAAAAGVEGANPSAPSSGSTGNGGGASDDGNNNTNNNDDNNAGVAAGSYNSNNYSHNYSYGYGTSKEAPPSPMSSVSSPSAGNHAAHPLLPGGGGGGGGGGGASGAGAGTGGQAGGGLVGQAWE